MIELKGLSREGKVASLTEAIHALAGKADEAAASRELADWLKAMARFHNYSWSNALLINCQRPDATFVAGFRQWEDKFNRRVVKGAKGIAILVPFMRRGQQVEEEEEETTRPRRRVFFGVGYVFDVSDTEGDPLPDLKYRPEGLEDRGLGLDLLAFASFEHITVTHRQIPGRAHGWSLPGLICIDPTYPPASQACTLAHELAHEYLHQRHGEKLSRSSREVEAEAAAAMVAYSYGIECPSENYIANWTESKDSGDRVLDRLDRIRAAAVWILDGIEASRATATEMAGALGTFGTY